MAALQIRDLNAQSATEIETVVALRRVPGATS